MLAHHAIVPRTVLSRGGLRGPLTLLLVALLASACSSAPRPTYDAETQVSFGVKMAREGLWREALFRFQNADRMQPGDPEVLNNLAVAYEAVGDFEAALAAYRQALDRAPGNLDVKRNYSRFTEFYQSFRPPEETDEESEGSEG